MIAPLFPPRADGTASTGFVDVHTQRAEGRFQDAAFGLGGAAFEEHGQGRVARDRLQGDGRLALDLVAVDRDDESAVSESLLPDVDLRGLADLDDRAVDLPVGDQGRFE